MSGKESQRRQTKCPNNLQKFFGQPDGLLNLYHRGWVKMPILQLGQLKLISCLTSARASVSARSPEKIAQN